MHLTVYINLQLYILNITCPKTSTDKTTKITTLVINQNIGHLVHLFCPGFRIFFLVGKFSAVHPFTDLYKKYINNISISFVVRISLIMLLTPQRVCSSTD